MITKSTRENKITKIEEDYAIFEDNWITKEDKVLTNVKGEEYNVLDFKETEEQVCLTPTLELYGIHNFYKKKCSCMKFDKPVSVGDVLYVKYKTYGK